MPAAILAALVGYVGFNGGGYDLVLSGQVGVAVWWAIALSAAVGAVGVDRLGRRGLVVASALAALTLWIGLSMIWSESAGRSAQELARASTYLGVLVGALLLRDRIGWRPLLGAVALAIAGLGAVAVLQRLQPDVLTDTDTTRLVAAAAARLNYPVDSWNGLAALLAICVPLLVYLGAHARRSGARALACAALPVLGLAIFWTLSRGGLAALLGGLVLLVALHPERTRLLAPLLAGGFGSAVLIGLAGSRQALTDGLGNPDHLSQGDEMTLLVPAVAIVAGLAPFGASWVGPRLRGRDVQPRLGARGRRVAATALIAALVATVVAADLPGRADRAWEDFKEPEVAQADRFQSASGNGRYQWWQAALEANASAPILGIGAGAYEFWWARNATIDSQVVDAHSLYLESLGELGAIGLLLVLAFVLGGLAVALLRALPPGGRRQPGLLAIAAAWLAFAIAAGTDWVWELPVVPISACILLAAGLGRDPGRPARRPGPRSRATLAAAALIGALVILPPLLGANSIRASRAQVEAGDLDAALTDADRAAAIEPYSGGASLQQALVLELQGRLPAAARAAREATRQEPTNWKNWLTRSRIEVKRVQAGESRRAGKAVEAYERARELNSNSPLFEGDLAAPDDS